MSITQFEEIVFSQAPIPADHYDQQYFHSAWRDGHNDYTIEARRRIEGRNPELIRDVFQPASLLDFGCGPGALLYLLDELGVRGEGVDFSRYARDSAPPAVRDRIHVLDADGEIDLGRQFDLVICREVFEHLTVRQVRRAVSNICRLSSRYVYVTTRYSRDVDDLLSVQTEPEVDPSHISLLNKDFLRCLFVLEGFRSRRDLEARMDWKNYGRVLVLERAV